MGAGGRSDRLVPARISRYRTRLAQGGARAGRGGLAGGRAVHAWIRAVVVVVRRQLPGRGADGRRAARPRCGGPNGSRRPDRARLGRDGGRRPGSDARQPVRQGRNHVGAALRVVPWQGPGRGRSGSPGCPASCCASGTSATSNCPGCQSVPRPGWCRGCGGSGHLDTTPPRTSRWCWTRSARLRTGAPQSATTGRPSAEAGHRNATPTCTAIGCRRRSCPPCTCTAPTMALPQPDYARWVEPVLPDGQPRRDRRRGRALPATGTAGRRRGPHPGLRRALALLERGVAAGQDR